VIDPGGRNNTLWFQEAPGATGEVQQRFHLDIVVPREVAEERVAAAVAAGGQLVTDEHAPAFWVLADAHGNKVCVCTADGREPVED
jgi:4a-hydroxytetrahydrobiopterin dehydratase